MTTPALTSVSSRLGAESSRLVSLDGLRGLAAVIVVFHHLALTLPAFADVYMRPGSTAPGGVYWWFTAGPGELLVAGPEAVLVFFVLSGLVVALPVLRSARFSWTAYYPRRLVRLYLPVIASVLLACVWILVSHQDPAKAASLWLGPSSIAELTPQRVLGSMDVLFGDTSLNNPLWSLRWEVIFSLALPVFVLVAVLGRRVWWAVLLACIPLVFIGLLWGNQTFAYLPVFLIGTVFAVKLDDAREWVSRPRVARWVPVGGAAVLVLSLFAINLHWLVWGLRPGSVYLRTAAGALVVVGAFGLVALAALWGPAMRLLASRFFRWLGKISFSLYLVHVPIIIAVSYIVGPKRFALAAAVSIVASFVVAALFFRFVEGPAHRLARRVGRGAEAVMTRSSPEAG
jgi:peptidoglycan/LPS O-acetylase OafA/YrhL